MNSKSTSSASGQRVTRRYWRKVENPEGGWWPWGWLPLLGLVAAMLYGMFFTAPELEAQTRDGVARALSAAEFDGFDVTADGQRVLITTDGPAGIRDRLIAVARGAVCDTFLAKKLICPTRVYVQMKVADAVADALPQAIPGQVAPAARSHTFSMRQGNAGLLLEGEVPSIETRDRLVTEARQRFGAVVDRLTVTNSAATNDYEKSIERAWQLLPSLDAGGVEWRDGAFSAWGRVPEEHETDVRQAFAAAGTGELSLTVIPSAGTCNQKFSDVLSSARIQFQTGSATISAKSQPLLRRLASLAADCPIALDVEGHTDNVGAVEFNGRLSLARAESVVAALMQLGVDATQLTPRGYGPNRPIADNGTADGRALNRRIEIRAGGK